MAMLHANYNRHGLRVALPAAMRVLRGMYGRRQAFAAAGGVAAAFARRALEAGYSHVNNAAEDYFTNLWNRYVTSAPRFGQPMAPTLDGWSKRQYFDYTFRRGRYRGRRRYNPTIRRHFA